MGVISKEHKNKIVSEIKYSNGTIYYGEIKRTKNGVEVPHGKGTLKLETGDEIKAIWKEGFYWKEMKTIQ
jgi:hypothetical protein